jgi:hypothetical protein
MILAQKREEPMKQAAVKALLLAAAALAGCGKPADTASAASPAAAVQLVSRDGYFTMDVPAGWEGTSITLDTNQIYVNQEDVQISVKLDYLNGYTVQEQAHRETFSTDTYTYDDTVPEGTAVVDGRTFYTAGPVADHGNLYYYLFGEWPPDPEKFINLSVEIFSTEDRARMAPVLAGDAYRSVLDSLKIHENP